MRRSSQRRASLLRSVLTGLLALPAVAAATVDIHGPWQLEANTGGTDIVDVVQAGDAVSFSYRGFALSGTLDAANRLQVAGGVDTALFLDGDVSADGELLNAGILTLTLTPFTSGGWTVLGRRCGCVDGNGDDGDGCNAECQVEPCWSCSGTPSVCVPAGDGAACDAGTCLAGGACTGGACGGGTPVVPCFDLGGSWNVHALKSILGNVFEVDTIRTIRQQGTHLFVLDSAAPTTEYSGTIDPANGAFSWTRTGGFFGYGLCGSGFNVVRMPFTGTMTGASFTATGTEVTNGTRCPLPVDVLETGTRTSTSSSTSTSTSSSTSSSTSTSTSAVVTTTSTSLLPGCADGDACTTGDPCVVGETCLGGACQGGTPRTCAPCEACDATLGCVATPRPVCAAPDEPAMLSIRNRPIAAEDKIDWKWHSPTALGPLGDPLAADGFTLCLYEVTGPPVLLFRSVVPAGGQCGARPCWKAKRDGSGFTYADKSWAHDGTSALQALSATRRGSRVKYSGRGTGLSGRPAGLPALPLSSSLLVQLQADGGACVGATYDAAGIRKNDAAKGTFRAGSQ